MVLSPARCYALAVAASGGEMTFWEHMAELRRRLVYSLVFLLAASTAGWFLAPRLLAWLVVPVQRAGVQLIALAPAEQFGAYLRVAVGFGLLLTLPFLLYQGLAFAWPGLERRERRVALLAAPALLILFGLGLVFAALVVVPFTFRFLLGFRVAGVTTTLALGSYVSFLINVVLPLGVVFELPLLAGVLAYLGVLPAATLRCHRRYAVLLIFVVAAVLTPPDPISQLLLAIPLLGLYELSILVAGLAGRGRS